VPIVSCPFMWQTRSGTVCQFQVTCGGHTNVLQYRPCRVRERATKTALRGVEKVRRSKVQREPRLFAHLLPGFPTICLKVRAKEGA